jgi:ubiquinone/menaquinone biosynthesis C-methylase UbiE
MSTTKRQTRERFAAVADRYRKSADHGSARDRDVLMARLSLSSGHLALDVATGGGQTAAALAGWAGRVVASDLSPEMLLEARTLVREKGLRNVSFVAGDAESLPFRDGAFDRVACRVAPHHFPDLPAALAEMARVTKPGGLVGVVDSVVPEDPALDAFLNGVERVRDPSHVRSLTVGEWVELVKKTGLHLVFASSEWKEHPFPEWVARTGRPPEVQREVEAMFLGAFPRAREYFRVCVEGGRVSSYADEKGIFVAKKF